MSDFEREDEEELLIPLNIDISDLNLNEYSGQNELVLRLQRIVAEGKIGPFDLKRIQSLQNLVKLKKDLDVLKNLIELKDKVHKLELERGIKS